HSFATSGRKTLALAAVQQLSGSIGHGGSPGFLPHLRTASIHRAPRAAGSGVGGGRRGSLRGTLPATREPRDRRAAHRDRILSLYHRGGFRRRFEEMRLDDLALVRLASTPELLRDFGRWQDVAWRRDTLALH